MTWDFRDDSWKGWENRKLCWCFFTSLEVDSRNLTLFEWLSMFSKNSCCKILAIIIILCESWYKRIHRSCFSGGSGREYACHFRRCGRHRFGPWIGRIPWRRKWQPTPVFLPGESHGQWRPVGYIQPMRSQKCLHNLETWVGTHIILISLYLCSD